MIISNPKHFAFIPDSLKREDRNVISLNQPRVKTMQVDTNGIRTHACINQRRAMESRSLQSLDPLLYLCVDSSTLANANLFTRVNFNRHLCCLHAF